MYILGLSCHSHDAAAVLLHEGRVIAAAEEERFSRLKHDSAFPAKAIAFCLRQAGIDSKDVDYVAFFEKPFATFDRLLLTSLGTAPRGAAVFSQAMTAWLLDKLWIKSTITEAVGVPEDRILFVPHHQAHAASAFYSSPFSDAAILTIDGVGEWTTTTIGSGRDGRYRVEVELPFPHSVGLLYSTFTAFLGCEVNEGEYKVMGMASYGRPTFESEVRRLVHQDADGSFHLDMDYFAFHTSTSRSHSARFEALFGPPRPMDREFDLANPDDQRYAHIASSVQKVTESLILGLARAAHARTQSPRLCMAGGVAYNSVAVGRILRETPFDEVYIQPAAGDAGAALGAAQHVWHQLLGRPRTPPMLHAAFGEAHNDDAVAGAIAAAGVTGVRLDNDDALIERTVELLLRGRVVGWVDGRFEWGPRALGQRSLLADPRHASMRDRVNLAVKFREPYRPFAPSMPAATLHALCETDPADRCWTARFMQMVAPVRHAAVERLAAVTHVDGTTRPQAVFPDAQPRYHQLLTTFGQASGVPALLNTSFNLRGEPIVNTPAEAIHAFGRSSIDALVLGRTLVLKPS